MKVIRTPRGEVTRNDERPQDVPADVEGFRWRGGASLYARAEAGGRGRIGMPWPLARMTIDRNAITFTLPLHEPFRFPRKLITRLEMNRRSLLVRIDHTHTVDEARFWPTMLGVLSRPLRWRMSAIHGQLRDLGYDVRLARR